MIKLILLTIFQSLLIIVHAQPRVWLSCPPSYDTSLTRQGVVTGPCERVPVGTRVPTLPIVAGARLKVGWTSGNRGGGFVRLSLAPESSVNQATFNSSVLKVTCFGYDSRDGRYAFGNCVHPCNGRPGCQYQSAANDSLRYDTTITVPYNLADGNYVIQLMAYVGNAQDALYSCARISVVGGNPARNCPRSQFPISTGCIVASAPRVPGLIAGSQGGAFCYTPTAVGAIDDAIRTVPVNVDCDPRVSCDLSVNAALCQLDIAPGSILDPTTNPRATCAAGVVPTQTFPRSTSTSPSKTSTTTTSTSSSSTKTSVTTTTTSTVTSSPRVSSPSPSSPTLVSKTTTTTTSTVTTITTSSKTTITTIVPPAPTTPIITPVPTPSIVTAWVTFTQITTKDVTKVVTVTATSVTVSQQVITTTVNAPVTACPTTPIGTPITTPTSWVTVVETVVGTPVPTPTGSGGSCYPTISPSEKCNPDTALLRCSGQQYAQCAWSGNGVGSWVLRNCVAGTVCKQIEGSIVCVRESEFVC